MAGIVPSDRVPDFGLSTGITLIASSASGRLEVFPVAYEGSFPVWTETGSATLPSVSFPSQIQLDFAHFPPQRSRFVIQYIIRPICWPTDPELALAMMSLC
jgi:hypothetical protein